MDHRASIRRVSRFLALPVVLAVGTWAGCGRSGYRTVVSGGIRCEVPRDWEHVPGGGPLAFFRSPEAVNGVDAFFAVSDDEVRDRAELLRWMEASRRIYARDPKFSMDDLREIPVAGVTGFLVGNTRTESAARPHGPRPGALLPPVKFREAEVTFSMNGKGYRLAFGAPEELFDRYHPDFEHFLTSLRVLP